MTLTQKLEHLRALIDTSLKELALESVIDHAKEIAANIGLSAECKAQAKRELDEARLFAIRALKGEKNVTPSILLKMADGAIGEKIYQFEYADRLNAGITHQLDLIRSIISYSKEERRAETNNNYFAS